MINDEETIADLMESEKSGGGGSKTAQAITDGFVLAY